MNFGDGRTPLSLRSLVQAAFFAARGDLAAFLPLQEVSAASAWDVRGVSRLVRYVCAIMRFPTKKVPEKKRFPFLASGRERLSGASASDAGQPRTGRNVATDRPKLDRFKVIIASASYFGAANVGEFPSFQFCRRKEKSLPFGM